MKKFLLLIFFFLYSFSSTAHMAHYNKYSKIEMEILKDGEVIGYNYYFFKKNKNETIVTNQIKFTVKLLGAPLFEIEGYHSPLAAAPVLGGQPVDGGDGIF